MKCVFIYGILLPSAENAKDGTVLRECIRNGTRNDVRNKIPRYFLFCLYRELFLRFVLYVFYHISRFLENKGMIFDVNM